MLGPALERTRDADLPLVERAQAWSQLGELYETVGRLPEATRQFDAVFEALVASDAPLESGSIDALRRLGRYLNIGQRGEDPRCAQRSECRASAVRPRRVSRACPTARSTIPRDSSAVICASEIHSARSSRVSAAQSSALIAC